MSSRVRSGEGWITGLNGRIECSGRAAGAVAHAGGEPRRRVGVAFAAWLLLTVCSGAAQAQEFDWGAGIREMFEQLVTSPIPDAVAPLITIAQNADELAVDAMAIAIGIAERETLNELASRPLDKSLEKRLKSLQVLKAQNRRIKRNLNPPHQEQDDDPFFGAMVSSGPITPPTAGMSVPARFDLERGETDPDLRAAAFLVFSGQITELEPSTLTADITIHNDNGPTELRVTIEDFTYELPSFPIEGVETGTTAAELDTTPGDPLGKIRLPSPTDRVGLVDLRLAVKLSNDLYGPTGSIGPSIPGFAQVRGVLDFDTGRAVLVGDDPILTPGKPGLVQRWPMFAAPSIAVFDADTRAIRFEDSFFDLEAGFDTGNDPTIAFLRFVDDSYATHENSRDRMLGASLVIADLHVASVSETMVTFDESELLIEDASGVMLRVRLTNISLKVATGDFFADLDMNDPTFVADTIGSPFLAEYLAFTGPRVQMMSPLAAGSLYLATERFTQTGQSMAIDFVNGVPEPTGMWVVLLAAFARRRRRRRRGREPK